MYRIVPLVLSVVFAFPGIGSAAPTLDVDSNNIVKPDSIIASRGGVTIDVALVEQKLAATPAEIRDQVLYDTEGFGNMLDSLLLIKQLATAAAKDGLAIDARDAAGTLPDDLGSLTELADAYVQDRVAEAVRDEDPKRYDDLARERYRANKAKYSTETTFRIRRVDISKAIYGEVAAKLLADEARNQYVEFLDSGPLHDSVPADDVNDQVHVTDLVVSRTEAYEGDPTGVVARALAQLKEHIGVSEVISSGGGFSIIVLLEIMPPTLRPYDQVHAEIVDGLISEQKENYKISLMRSFSLQPVDLNYSVIQSVMKLDALDRNRMDGG